jgi:hypothetical protein
MVQLPCPLQAREQEDEEPKCRIAEPGWVGAGTAFMPPRRIYVGRGGMLGNAASLATPPPAAARCRQLLERAA